MIGTAGHIDHGKTALVRALTGIDCDRLPEEKKRGITIDLGFADWDLGDGRHESIIDVPGHEKFVRTMVAGASGIDLVLWIVAADDGVMPQSVEHLQICEFLGVGKGIIVITKSDLVDEEMLALVEEDARQATAGTFLEGAPLVCCSSQTGDGLAALKKNVLENIESEDAQEGAPYLPIDRSFAMPGFGNVVTGTLVRGELKIGDEVCAEPGHQRVRVRGIQVHGRDVEHISTRERVALNLKGSEFLKRGQVIISNDNQTPTEDLLVELSLTHGDSLPERSAISFHVGTVESPAVLSPVAENVYRVSLDHEILVFADDRFVIRRSMETIGGGRVVDPHPIIAKGMFKRWATNVEGLLATGEERRDAIILDAGLRGITQMDLKARLPSNYDLADIGEGALWLSPAVRQIHEESLLSKVDEFHLARPAKLGATRAEIVNSFPETHRPALTQVLGALVGAGALKEKNGHFGRCAHMEELHKKNAPLKIEITTVFRNAKFTPPSDDEACQIEKGVFLDLLGELKSEGVLKRIGDFHFHRTTLDELQQRVETHFAAAAQMSVEEFKKMTGGISRKYAVPLLGYLDAEGITSRQGDLRVPGRR